MEENFTVNNLESVGDPDVSRDRFLMKKIMKFNQTTDRLDDDSERRLKSNSIDDAKLTFLSGNDQPLKRFGKNCSFLDPYNVQS